MDGGADARRITIHAREDFVGMRAAGRLAAEALDMITEHVRPGIATGTLDTLCHEFIIAHDAVPAPLNYRGYPKSICTSINHVVCHGIPGERKLENGDVLNIDVTVILNGWHGDSSRMYVAGIGFDAGPQPDGRDVRGDDARRPRGEAWRDPGRHRPCDPELCGRPALQRGAGLLRARHWAPLPRATERAAFRPPGEGPVLRPGMFFTIEPMVNAGRPEVKVLDDGWTAVTRDRSLSAQFEHMIGVTEKGCEIFTLSPSGFSKPPYGTD